ncbi:MAG: flagellin [Syntrophobacteraceae bacterium]
MRISFAVEKEKTLLWINQRKEEISRLTNAVSSGKKLTAPSDAPAFWAQAMGLKQGLREYDSVLGNIDFAVGWNQATDAALNNVSDLISHASQIAISATSATGSDQRAALASELDAIIEEMLKDANSQYGDQYVFAGTDNGSAPFSIDDSTGVVTYAGDEGAVAVRTDRGADSAQTVNLTGAQAFSYSSGGSTLNVIHEVWELKQAVSSADSTAINAKLGTLDDAFNAISQQSAIVGSRLSGLDNRKSAISLIKTNTEGRLSDIEDTDLAEGLTRLQQQTTAFEAALQVTALVDDLNLANLLS